MLEAENMPVDDIPEEDGDYSPRQSYNFAPGYHGIVYRASTPDWGSGPAPRQHLNGIGPIGREGENDNATAPMNITVDVDASNISSEYKLQSMKWGLVPFWTKRNPDYASMLKTINCRDDSLSTSGGMWSTMKARKRCIVIAQGFYEWLKVGPKEKVPHYIKRKDGQLMCFAGLWDCVQYEGKLDN
jgi:putative SOS response-associated peptidase YedK